MSFATTSWTDQKLPQHCRIPVQAIGLLALIVLLASMLNAGDAELEQGRRQAVQRAVKTTVAIECKTARGGYFGTGVLISKDGHILTNITVVPEGASNLQIWIKGESQTYDAKIVESDSRTEGVLLQITSNRRDFPCAELLDTEKIPLGSHVFTMGNPLHALKNDDQVAVSSGIVSGLYKLTNADKESKYDGLVLETDAAVNPGSDGGPMFDEKGRLVGIITLGHAAERLQGCAIPTHILYTALPKLQEVVKTYMGGRLSSPVAPTDPTEAALGAAAAQIAPYVLRLDIEREPDKLPGINRRLPPQIIAQLQQQMKLLSLTLRPEAPATGLLISKNEIVTAATLVTARGKIMGAVKSMSWTDPEGQTHPLTLVGAHELLDVALLKIEGYEAKQFAPFETDAALPGPAIGSGVAVVGRIRGSEGITFTKGMVSAVGRGLGLNRVRAYQTDALINYGNVGGPVVDIHGKIVGLAGQIRIGSQWGQSAGVGLFVGAKDLAATLPDLRAGKTIVLPSRTYLGVEFESESKEEGAAIRRVQEDSPASQAGLLKGDLVVEADENPIAEWQELLKNITQKRPGDRVMLVVKRGTEELELTVVLGAHDDPTEATKPGEDDELRDLPPGFGQPQRPQRAPRDNLKKY